MESIPPDTPIITCSPELIIPYARISSMTCCSNFSIIFPEDYLVRINVSDRFCLFFNVFSGLNIYFPVFQVSTSLFFLRNELFEPFPALLKLGVFSVGPYYLDSAQYTGQYEYRRDHDIEYFLFLDA